MLLNLACLQSTKVLDQVHDEDWTPQTLPTWRHSNWVGVWDPWIVVFKGPRVWYSVIREIVTIERMHRAFARGLMEYGMIRGHKTISSLNSGSVAENINVTTASNGRSGNRVKGKSLSVDSQGSGRTISANFAWALKLTMPCCVVSNDFSWTYLQLLCAFNLIAFWH